MVLLVLGTRFRNFQVQPRRTTTSISEVVFKLVLDPHRQRVRGPGILDTERLQTAHSPNMFHLILHIESVLQLTFSANKKQNLGGQNTHEVVVVANGSERRAQNPAPCHRMITSNLCYTHRPVNYHRVLVHLLQGLLACIHIIHTHQPNPAISRMMERLTRGSGGSHPRAHMRSPQHQQQRHCFPLLQHQQKVAIHTLLQCPFMFQNSEPIHMSTRKQQQKQLRYFQGNYQPDLHRVIGAHQLRCWSHFGKQLTLLSKLFVANCKTAAVQVANSRLLLRTMRRYHHRRRHHQPFLFQQQQQRNQHRSQHR